MYQRQNIVVPSMTCRSLQETQYVYELLPEPLTARLIAIQGASGTHPFSLGLPVTRKSPAPSSHTPA